MYYTNEITKDCRWCRIFLDSFPIDVHTVFLRQVFHTHIMYIKVLFMFVCSVRLTRDAVCVNKNTQGTLKTSPH